MFTYILECVAFQLTCLLVYDLFLKKETFFQWNRAYLLLSFLLSLVLPWVKIEALKTTVSKEAVYYPANWFVQMEGVMVGENKTVTVFWEHFSAWEWAYIFGVLGMTVWLVVKLYKIRKLHQKGFKKYYPEYTRVTVQESNVAFSFFKSIFMGDALPKNKEQQILEHELVHIKQWHSLDLFFFELMRIAFWFNPLVYVYQSRVAELHEFIADAKVAKEHKKQQYAILLSQAFKTENISFINQFFTQSLIKKRIVMLSKQKSKRIFQLKYILLIPLVLGMLVYTSCEQREQNEEEDIEAVFLNQKLGRNDSIVETSGIPFAIIDQVPVFPGCENAADKRACFQESIQNHIRKHFNYPLEAQEQNIQGRVSLMFTIQEDGTIGNIEKRGPHALLENEAVRIIERLPKMEPGKHKGEVVSVPFSIPITFMLQEEHGINIDNAIKQFSKRDANRVPFTEIENPPVFPGCEGAADARACFNEKMINHIKKHFNYPQEAKEKGIQGRVALMFVINTKGEIVDIQKRGPSPVLEAEAERIIKRLPKMQPASNNGQLANVSYAIPITFKL